MKSKKQVLGRPVRLQTLVKTETAARIDSLAKAMGWSRNQAVEFILDHCTKDVEYLVSQTELTIRGALRLLAAKPDKVVKMGDGEVKS